MCFEINGLGVELRAGGDLHGPEKLEWSAGDMAKQRGNEMKNNNKMKIKNKNLLEVLPNKYHRWEFLFRIRSRFF